MCAKHYENPTMLSRVTAKNVGDVFLRHTVDSYSCTHQPTDHKPKKLGQRDLICSVIRSNCANNSFCDRCFEAAGPCLWNTLPVYLQQCNSLGQFKRLLKTHLFDVWDHGVL